MIFLHFMSKKIYCYTSNTIIHVIFIVLCLSSYKNIKSKNKIITNY